MTTNDGGPAFPGVFQNDCDCNIGAPDGRVVPPGGSVQVPGMSLRDYFAAQALTTYSAEYRGESDLAYVELAERCYQIADAMLAERAK